jgi:multiple sugar transport system ATP-binding protein
VAEVRLRQVTKIFRDERRGYVTAVDDVSLDVRDGEFMVLLGPSGCGKTTSLRMIAGLERQTAGDILIGDRIVNKMRPKERDIAMVFQDYALYPHMSVYDNLSFGLTNLGTPRKEVDSQVARTAALLGIESLLRRKPRELSGGQRQRVALGRAIIRSPKVFLFDDPLSNLDARLRIQMRVELVDLHNRLGTTMIYVTHDQIEAMTLGQRIAIMRDGIVQQVDTPRVIYEQPANMFVGGFIGAPPMNFLDGELSADGHFVAGNLAIQLPAEARSRLKIDQGKAILGIRPEDIQSSADQVGIAGLTKFVEYLGSEALAYITVDGFDLVARLPASTNVLPNDPCWLSFDYNRMVFFDPVTQERIG